MSLYPRETNMPFRAQTDAIASLTTNLYSVVRYDAGSPDTLDADGYVTITNMIVGAYTLLRTTPLGGGARNVTVTHATVAAGTDTIGTVVVVGTDLSDAVITETITPGADAVTQGTMAFKTITSITSVGWAITGGNDTVTFGWGDLIGLPDMLIADTTLIGVFNAVREAIAAVTFSATVLALNTVDMTSALDGSTVTVYYIA